MGIFLAFGWVSDGLGFDAPRSPELMDARLQVTRRRCTRETSSLCLAARTSIGRICQTS